MNLREVLEGLLRVNGLTADPEKTDGELLQLVASLSEPRPYKTDEETNSSGYCSFCGESALIAWTSHGAVAADELVRLVKEEVGGCRQCNDSWSSIPVVLLEVPAVQRG